MFSVVAYDERLKAPAPPMPEGMRSSEALLVRTRAEGDLRAMLSALELSGSRALSTPNADYPWRAMLSRGEWGRFLDLEIQDLDYPNFKSRILEAQGPARHDVYSRVWSTLRAIDRADAPTSSAGNESPLW